MKHHVAAVVTVLLCCGVSEAQEYAVIAVPVDVRSGGDAYGRINSAGAVAGAFATGNGLHAFVYDPAHGAVVDIGTLGGTTSRANDINNAGTVVGRSTTVSEVTHAFRYTAVGGIVDIHALVGLGGANSSALGIDDEGNIVGWAETANGAVHAFVFDAASQTTRDLHSSPGWPAWDASAYDIDGRDEVVGMFTDSSGTSHGFVYSLQDDTFADVGTLGGADSVLFRRRASTSVGAADVTGTVSRAIAFDRRSGLVDLGTLGGTSSIAFDINNGGTIVGSAKTADEETRAFVHAGLGMRDLNDRITDPDWYLLEAQGINDAGAIVGTGYLNGEHRIFVLTPVPDTTPPVLTVPTSFSVDPLSPAGTSIGFSVTATDDVDGVVTATCTPASGSFFPIGTTLVSCTASDQAGNTGTGSFTVIVRAVPTITWQSPASIVHETPLSAVQLSAVANVPGTFAYTPVVGTLLSLGAGQPLTATFTPADSAHYTTAQMQVTIDVVSAGPPAPARFHAVGDLAGGPTISVVRDATKAGGVLYAVGGAAANNQVLCTSPNNPAGCVPQFGPDTAVLWTSDANAPTLTSLPNLVAPPWPPTNLLMASAITRTGDYIASQARSSATDPAQKLAVRVTRNGLTNLNLGAPPFLGLNQPASAVAISDDGSIVYVVSGFPQRALRFDINTSSRVFIPLLLPSHTGNIVAGRGTSFDGTVMVGTSFVFPLTGSNGRAFRYLHGSPAGTVSAIPLLAGGTWNKALAVSPDGRLALVAGNSTTLPHGELYLYDASSGVTTPLGSPNTPWTPTDLGGMTADGSVVAVTLSAFAGGGGGRHAYIHNAHGWFHLTTILGANGINIGASGWDLERLQINGISPDGTLVFGQGERGDAVEGFVAEFSPGYLASFDFPAVRPTDTSIVGVWTGGDQLEDAIAFLADGTYFLVIPRYGSPPSTDHGPGFERGRYRWDPSTGVLTFATLQDTNGSYGLSGGNGFQVPATVSGDTLDIGNGAIVLTRVATTPGSIVGGWVFGDPTVDGNSGVVIFGSDGTVVAAEDGDSADHPDGIEAGTYTWDASGAFSVTVTLDTNGGLGASHGPGSSSFMLPLSADGLRLGEPGDQLLRIVDPQAVVPVITSALSTTATSGYPFAYQITATRVPSSYGAAGLPAGLAIDTSSGLISGSPIQTGIFDVTISASNTLSTGSAHLQLAVIAPIVTEAGSDVVVTPSAPPGAAPVPVTLQFETVTQGGVTAITAIDPVTVSGVQGLPSGFSLGDPPLYYEIQTTASFAGPITVCFNYAGMSFSGFPRLLHYEPAPASWVDITTSVDAATRTICGLTASLSPFALAASALDAVGFHSPIGPVAGEVKVVKGGSTVPLKFNVYRAGGIEITEAAEISNLSFTVTAIGCSAGEPEELVPFTTTGSTSLRYDSTAAQFVQNWKTPSTQGCYIVRVTGDGLLLTARFKVK